MALGATERRDVEEASSRSSEARTAERLPFVQVDLYIPRKCSWTNRLIGASDQASVQINVGTIDPNTGLHTGGSETYALSGYVRNKGESDMALTELVRKADESSA